MTRQLQVLTDENRSGIEELDFQAARQLAKTSQNAVSLRGVISLERT